MDSKIKCFLFVHENDVRSFLKSFLQILTAKLVQGGGNLVSSPDSSSDSSTGSPHNTLDSSPNEDEIFLPGVVRIFYRLIIFTVFSCSLLFHFSVRDFDATLILTADYIEE